MSKFKIVLSLIVISLLIGTSIFMFETVEHTIKKEPLIYNYKSAGEKMLTLHYFHSLDWEENGSVNALTHNPDFVNFAIKKHYENLIELIVKEEKNLKHSFDNYSYFTNSITYGNTFAFKNFIIKVTPQKLIEEKNTIFQEWLELAIQHHNKEAINYLLSIEEAQTQLFTTINLELLLQNHLYDTAHEHFDKFMSYNKNLLSDTTIMLILQKKQDFLINKMVYHHIYIDINNEDIQKYIIATNNVALINYVLSNNNINNNTNIIKKLLTIAKQNKQKEVVQTLEKLMTQSKKQQPINKKQ